MDAVPHRFCVDVVPLLWGILSWSKPLKRLYWMEIKKKCVSFVCACPAARQCLLEGPLGSVLHSMKELKHVDSLTVIIWTRFASCKNPDPFSLGVSPKMPGEKASSREWRQGRVGASLSVVGSALGIQKREFV